MADLSGGQGMNLGVDAVSQPAPMMTPDSALGSMGPGPAEMPHDASILNRTMAPPGLERFHNQQTQPDHEPIMNALGMLHMIGNTFLPKSQLAGAAEMRPPTPGQQAPGLWQRPPIAMEQPEALPFPVRPGNQPNPFGAEMPPMSNQSSLDFGAPSQDAFIDSTPGDNPITQNMRPPPQANDTQISNTMVQPQSMSDPAGGMSSMESMQPPAQPQQQPSMMQQGNTSLLEHFNTMSPAQQIQALTAALGLGVGGGIGYGLASQPQPQQQEPSWYGVPAPRATQR